MIYHIQYIIYGIFNKVHSMMKATDFTRLKTKQVYVPEIKRALNIVLPEVLWDEFTPGDIKAKAYSYYLANNESLKQFQSYLACEFMRETSNNADSFINELYELLTDKSRKDDLADVKQKVKALYKSKQNIDLQRVEIAVRERKLKP